MGEDPKPEPAPEPEDDDEEEASWKRLSPRLRGLIREELDEADKRRAPAKSAEPPAPKPEPAPAPEPKKETPTPNEPHPTRRTAADIWFGRRRS